PPAERGGLEMLSSLTTVQAREGGQTLVRLGKDSAAAPGLIASTYGEGRVVYVAAGLDQAMFFFPNAFIGQMLVNATKWVAGAAKAPIETDGPLILAVTYRRQPAQRRTIVHLLNDQSSYGRHSLY